MTGRPSRIVGRLWPLLSLTLLLCAAAALAQPRALDHYDAKAPCFRWPAVDYDGDGIYDRIDRCPGSPKGCLVDESGCSLDADGDGVCDGLDQCLNTPASEKVDAKGCSSTQRAMMNAARDARTTTPTETPRATHAPAPPAQTPSPRATETERQLVEGGRVRLENIYFESGQATLLPESETSLNEAGLVLEKFVDLQIEVGGHTDTRGSGAMNQRLSQARAESVRHYMLSHFQLKPDNLVARGYGETQPETQELNQEEMLRNRRVELKVLNPEVLPRNVKVDQK
ncbi:MAG: OmpA family protein [Candidatus Eisenbacteria bacterium]